jgi:hypothetical protein
MTQDSVTQDPLGDPELVLGVLTAVHENQHVTQRSVARELGIALGLANAYVKRCVRKGLIKVAMAPTKRYAYYLTPAGFAEKSQLTAQYLYSSFEFFRGARSQCAACFVEAGAKGWSRIALAGLGDLAEIAMLCARDYPVSLLGILAAQAKAAPFAGLTVVATAAELGELDAILITDLANPQRTFDDLAISFPAERLIAPKLLRIARGAAQREAAKDPFAKSEAATEKAASSGAAP